MTGIGNFLRNYEFLNLTKSVTESQMALYKEPHKTWSQVGSKLWNISCYNGLSVAAVGADVATYLFVSTLRGVGLFCPPPPQPPVFSAPHDNVQFIDQAIRRALWDWELSARKQMEEGIESSFSERWNVFQVVGEWSIAYCFENESKSSLFKPTFLTISEPLENGASFVSVLKDFGKLWQKEKKTILEAIYHQSPPPSLGSKANLVYQNIRALASKLHQGNQNYLTAYSGYVAQKDQPPPYSPPPASSSGSSVPSAPSLPQRNIEREMAENVSYLRRSFQNLPRFVSEILSDRTGSPKNGLAPLVVLQAFQDRLAGIPGFLPWNDRIANGKAFRTAEMEFNSLSARDFEKLREAVLQPWRRSGLSDSHKERLDEVNEFGRILARNPEFGRAYDALRIDLLAT